MNKSAFVLTLAMPLVAGCGVLTDTKIVDRAAFNGSPSEIYQAVIADGENTVGDALFAEGLTGFVGGSDGTVKEIRVRLDPENPIAYIAADGQPEIAYEIDFASIDEYSGYLVLFNEAAQYAYTNWYGDQPAYVSFGDEETGVENWGFYGLETDVANLPTGSVVYNGYFDVEGWNETTDTGIEEANLALAVNFENSSLSGIADGYFYSYDYENDIYDSGRVIGTVEGTVAGSRIAGSMNVAGAASGQLDMMGAFYGDAAQNLAGGMGGSLTSDTGTQTVGGEFILYGDIECGLGCR